MADGTELLNPLGRAGEVPGLEDALGGFEDAFLSRAGDPEAYHDMMRTAFGQTHDGELAESLRQRALKGDLGWLPETRIVDGGALGAALGAYDAKEGVVYLRDDVVRAPGMAARVYGEEVGHHLDALLNRSDAAGDEGAIFRKLLFGEAPGAAELAALRAEDDRGVMMLEGREIAVEQWGGFKKIGKAIKSAAKGVVEGAKEVGKGVFDAAEGVVSDLVGTAKGFVSDLKDLRLGDALARIPQGLSGLVKAPLRIADGALGGLGLAAGRLTGVLGPFGEPLRDFLGGGLAIGRGVLQRASGIVDGVFDLGSNLLSGLGNGILDSGARLLRGDLKGAAASLGGAVLSSLQQGAGDVVDVLAQGLRGVIDVFSTGLLLQRPPRGLRAEEQALLADVFGDSLDSSRVRIVTRDPTRLLGMSSHVVGNTLYLRDYEGKELRDDAGRLTPAGQLLVHEATHAWQYQQGGDDYIHQALWANFEAWLRTGDRNEAYRWRGDAAKGVPFGDLNPEQQGEVIAAAAQILNGRPAGGAARDYVLDALEQVRRGDVRV